MSFSPNKKLNLKLLVNNFINSDRKAYAFLFDFYWQGMYVYAFSLVQNEHNAKDIVQEIWINLWNRRATLHNENFEAYLRVAVRNNCYKHLKKKPFSKVHLDVIQSLDFVYSPKVEQLYDLKETERLIENTVKKLPKRCQEIYNLSRHELIPNEQIAYQLGISKRTVENQISTALKAIREQIFTN